jgi:chorismate lyase / 3-hydroxybenzoate synthase
MRSPSLSLAPDRSRGAIATRFAPAAEVAGGLKRNVLACIRFGRHADCGDDPREVPLMLDALAAPGARAGDPPPVELWTSDRPVTFDRDNGIAFAHNGEFLFGHIYLLEVELESVAAAAFQAYARLTAFLGQQGYPWLLRCWNFLHDINRGTHDQERYRQFCLGRYQALAGSPGFERQLPAATAIGMHEPGLLLYFMAGKAPGVQVENPRQVPAFQYPRMYGPRSPSFSRATFARLGGEPHLLVSGTASVVGHATRHPDDTLAQLDETVANLEALLAEGSQAHLGGAAWRPETLRLFLRNRAQLPEVHARLEQRLGRDAPVVLLEGDICRRDLHLEIEGLYAGPGTAGA